MRVEPLVHFVAEKFSAFRVKFDQLLLHRRRQEYVPILCGYRKRMHAHVVVCLGVGSHAVAEDAAVLRTFIVRHFEDFVLVRFRIEGVDAIHQVVADVNLAVWMRDEIVHLGKAIAYRPFGYRYRRQA